MYVPLAQRQQNQSKLFPTKKDTPSSILQATGSYVPLSERKTPQKGFFKTVGGIAIEAVKEKAKGVGEDIQAFKKGEVTAGQVAAEMPETLKKTGETIFGGVKQIVQAPLRFITRTGLSAAEAITGVKQTTELSPEGEALFGTKELSTFQESYKHGAETVKRLGGTPLEQTTLPVAGIISGAIIDLSGYGGEKGAIEALVRATTESDAAKIFRNINVSEDLTKQYAPLIAKTTDKNEVKRIVDHIVKLQKTTKEVPISLEKLDQMKTDLSIRKEALNEHPAKPLVKYANKKTGELPEVLGKGGKFAKQGDEFASQQGFKDSEEARTSYQQYLKQKEDIATLEKQIKESKVPEVVAKREGRNTPTSGFPFVKFDIPKVTIPGMGDIEAPVARAVQAIKHEPILQSGWSPENQRWQISIEGRPSEVMTSAAKKEGLVTETRIDPLQGGKTITHIYHPDAGIVDQKAVQRAFSDFGRRYELPMGTGTELTVLKANIGLPKFKMTPEKRSIAQFLPKMEIKKAGIKTKDFFNNILTSLKNAFAPDLLSKEAGLADPIIAKNIAELSHNKNVLWQMFKERVDWWTTVPEKTRFDFIDLVERGNVSPKDFSQYPKDVAQTLSDLAKEYRQRLDVSYFWEKDVGINIHYLTDYFPHLWEDLKKAQAFFAQYAKRIGSDRFAKTRFIDLISEGRAAGLKLRTSNPEEVVLMREMDGSRVVNMVQMMKELTDNGLAELATETTNTVGKGRVIGADGKMYYVPPGVDQVLNNAIFSRSLWSDKTAAGSIFRSLMSLKNIFVPIKLAFSLFHPIHIATISSSARRAVIWERMFKEKGGFANGLKNLIKAKGGFDQVKAVQDGMKIVRAYDKPIEQLTDYEKTALQYIAEGGGSPKMSAEFRANMIESFKKSLREQRYTTAVMKAPLALIDGMQKPIFEAYIPSLKVYSYLNEVKMLFERNPSLLDNDVARMAELRQVWKSVDNRFGELAYNTLFWNKWLKEIGIGSSLSLGWSLGFVREFPEGIFDAAKFFGKALTGKATRDDITRKMLFTLDYTVQAAAMLSLIHYAFTGKAPESVKDVFYPQTGGTNPDGSPSRYNSPFYTKEYFTYAEHVRKEGLITGTLNTIKNKANPVLAELFRIWSNQDFYGTEIRDPNAPYFTQLNQLLGYLSKAALPISATSFQQAKKTIGTKGEVMAFLGFSPAPKYITSTKLQNDIYALTSQRFGGIKTLESAEATKAKSEIRSLYQQGNITEANKKLSEAMDKGYIKPKGLKTFEKAADLPGDVRAFRALPAEDQRHLVSTMSLDEIQRYAWYVHADVKIGFGKLSPDAKKFVDLFLKGDVKPPQWKQGKIVQ